MPFHLWLALPDAKAAIPHGDAHDARRLVAAALLKAVGKAQLIDVKTRVKWLYSDHKVEILKRSRKLPIQVDEAFARLAVQQSDCE